MSRSSTTSASYNTLEHRQPTYVIAGVIPEIAADLGVTETAAGQLVTAFSLTIAAAAAGLVAVVLYKAAGERAPATPVP